MPLFGPPSIDKLERQKNVKGLIKVLSHWKYDSDLRQAAAVALGRLGDNRAVEPLIKELEVNQSPWQAEFRQSIVEALSKLGDPQAVDPLIRELGGAHLGVRQSAAVALGELCGVERLVKDLGHTNARVRQSAAWALAKRGDSRGVDTLVQELATGDSESRQEAATALGGLGNARALEPLTLALADGDPKVRRAAAAASETLGEVKWTRWVKGDDKDFERLGDSGQAQIVEPLILAMEDPDRKDREAAVKALAKLGDLRAVDSLIQALEDNDHSLRCAAARALGALGDTRAVEPLIRAFSLSGMEAAADALGTLGDTRAVEPLIRALDKSPLAAAEALGELGDSRAVQPLIGTLWEFSYSRKKSAAALDKLGEPAWKEWVRGEDEDFTRLGTSGDPRAVVPLINALERGKNYFETKCAVQALGSLGDPRALSPLAKALKDSRFRDVVVEALGKLNGVQTVQPLIQSLGDMDPEVRRASAAALDRLGESKWKDWIQGEEKDFERLGISGDSRAVEPLIRALGNLNPDLRRAASESLDRLGDPAWKSWVKGDAGDFARLSDAPDDRAADPLREVAETLISRLKVEKWEQRKIAAAILIDLAKCQPGLLGNQWDTIAFAIRSEHADGMKHFDESGSYSDCKHSDTRHVDNGIGLAFPDRPPHLDF